MLYSTPTTTYRRTEVTIVFPSKSSSTPPVSSLRCPHCGTVLKEGGAHEPPYYCNPCEKYWSTLAEVAEDWQRKEKG